MIPDKIYISHLCDTTIDGEEGHLMAMSFEDNGGKEYIHKDALIEWARNSLLDEYPETNQFAMGYRQSTRDLIDKLNKI